MKTTANKFKTMFSVFEQRKGILAHQSHLEYEGKRLWENQAHHFRDLCKDSANSGTGGKWAILIENEESEKF